MERDQRIGLEIWMQKIFCPTRREKWEMKAKIERKKKEQLIKIHNKVLIT
jgi:hypothetical protein